MIIIRAFLHSVNTKRLLLEENDFNDLFSSEKSCFWVWTFRIIRSICCVTNETEGGNSHGKHIHQRPVPGRRPGRKVRRNHECSFPKRTPQEVPAVHSFYPNRIGTRKIRPYHEIGKNQPMEKQISEFVRQSRQPSEASALRSNFAPQ